MKQKLYMLLVALFACFSMNAAYENHYFNLPGGYNEWKDNGVALNGDGAAVMRNFKDGATVTSIGSNEFKVRIWNGSGEEWYSTGNTIAVNKWVSNSGNNNNNMKVSSSTPYMKAVWDHSKKRIWIGEDCLYVIGYVNGGKFNPKNGFKLTRIANKKYQGTLDIGSEFDQDGAFFSFAETIGNEDTDDNDWASLGVRYGAESNEYAPAMTNDSYTANAVNLSNSYNKDNSFKVEPGNYTITVDFSASDGSMKFYIKCNETFFPEKGAFTFPDKLWMVGDIKGSDWAQADTYVADNEDGIYTFPRVSIYDGTVSADNYFGFFGKQPVYQSNGEFDYEKMLPRFTAALEQVNAVQDKNASNAEFDKNEIISKGFQERRILPHNYNRDPWGNEQNYRITWGYYKVVVDMNRWVITLYPCDKVELDWHNGAGDMLKEADFSDVDGTDYTHKEEDKSVYGIYEVAYSPEGRNVQVGVDGDARHDVADRTKFEVWKANNANGVRALAETNFPGYTKLTEGTDYTVTKTSDMYNVVNLKNVGTYKVVAKFNEGNADKTLYDVYGEVEPSVLDVIVSPAKVALIPVSEGKIYQKFSNAATNNFEIALDNTDIPAENIDVTFVPNGDWNNKYTDLASNEQAEVSSMQGNIDGEYKTIQPSQLSIDGESGEFTVKVANLPCSGVYTMTLASNSSNYTLNEEVTVEVYPTVLNVYEQTQYEVGNGVMATVSGKFNVNGIHWTSASEDYDGIIVYPIVDGKLYKDGVLDKSRIFTPGLYFADMYIYSPQEPVQTKVRMLALSNGLNDNYRSYTIGSDFDLSKLSGSAPAELNVYVSKNGASAPILASGDSNEKFQITAKDSGYTLPTGVETIGAEDGEAEYFNLQGVKVANPEHGIYVKVQNGKAEKVVL